LAAGAAYGKVSSDEYLKLLAAAERKRPTLQATLREDYEMHTNESGQFYVSYHCGCEKCGLEFRFEHTEQVPL
jgi:hypothetical protein